METIEVWRGQSTTDTDGNPVTGEPVLVETFPALVAPLVVADKTGEDGRPVKAGYTLFFRQLEPTGITQSDLVKVRGQFLHVTGEPEVWIDAHGRHVGDIVHAMGRRR